MEMVLELPAQLCSSSPAPTMRGGASGPNYINRPWAEPQPQGKPGEQLQRSVDGEPRADLAVRAAASSPRACRPLSSRRSADQRVPALVPSRAARGSGIRAAAIAVGSICANTLCRSASSN
jgi:hypothetical protein